MSHIGTNKIGKVYLGDTEIAKAYLGSNLVYQNGPVVPPDYFWTEAIDSGTFTFTINSNVTTTMVTSVSYSTDGGSTWATTPNVTGSSVTITTPNISAGSKVLWKGIGKQYAYNQNPNNCSSLTCTTNFNIGGNIASLLYGDNFMGSQDSLPASLAYCGLFYNNSRLINTEDLLLPAKTGTQRCYQSMFGRCSNLLTAPTILVETIALCGMYAMFENCTSLVKAPEINVTSITGTQAMMGMFSGCSAMTTPPPELKTVTINGSSCYQKMFNNCSKLTSAPIIRATGYASNKIQLMREMFYGCKELTTAPDLNLLVLPSNCYYQMFKGCTKLNYIKMMATDVSASNCLYNWVYGTASSGTFVKNSAASWTTTGVNGVPSGWTVETASS